MNTDKNLCVSVYICDSFFIYLYFAPWFVSPQTIYVYSIPVREDTNRGAKKKDCFLGNPLNCV